jgi:hypothetical protein
VDGFVAGTGQAYVALVDLDVGDAYPFREIEHEGQYRRTKSEYTVVDFS